jgi:hypothetical protein
MCIDIPYSEPAATSQSNAIQPCTRLNIISDIFKCLYATESLNIRNPENKYSHGIQVIHTEQKNGVLRYPISLPDAKKDEEIL